MLRSRAVAKENPSNSCSNELNFGFGNGFLTNLLFNSQKLLRKCMVLSFFGIDRNCNLLPLSLDDLLNHTTLMLKFCKNKHIGVLLLRQVFFRGGKRAFCSKKGVTFHPWAKYFREKKILRKFNTY